MARWELRFDLFWVNGQGSPTPQAGLKMRFSNDRDSTAGVHDSTAREVWTTEGVDEEVSGKSLRNGTNQMGQIWASRPGQRTCGDDKAFAVGTNAKRVASRALGSIFSGRWAAKWKFRVAVPRNPESKVEAAIHNR
jgi:hypothetical protein